MNNAFVYCWSDKATSKVYVGVHKGHEDDGYVCSSKRMKLEYTNRQHDFTRQIIAKGSFEDCAELEIRINKELLKDLETCYNRCAGKAIINDAATKKIIGQKVSIARKGKLRPPEVGIAISKAKKGVKFSKEHKEALSRAQQGRKDSPERIAIRAIALKGINKEPKTDATKAKISLRLKELWQDPEYRARLVKAHTKMKEV